MAILQPGTTGGVDLEPPETDESDYLNDPRLSPKNWDSDTTNTVSGSTSTSTSTSPTPDTGTGENPKTVYHSEGIDRLQYHGTATGLWDDLKSGRLSWSEFIVNTPSSQGSRSITVTEPTEPSPEPTEQDTIESTDMYETDPRLDPRNWDTDTSNTVTESDPTSAWRQNAGELFDRINDVAPDGYQVSGSESAGDVWQGPVEDTITQYDDAWENFRNNYGLPGNPTRDDGGSTTTIAVIAAIGALAYALSR